MTCSTTVGAETFTPSKTTARTTTPTSLLATTGKTSTPTKAGGATWTTSTSTAPTTADGPTWTPYTLHYQIRVQHQIRVQADHFEIFNKNTASNNNTGNQIMKFSVIMHSLFD